MTETVFRPNFAGAYKQFALLGALYLLLAVALCVSLAFWALQPLVALLLGVVLVALMTLGFARSFLRTTITVNDTTVTLHSPWAPADRVLNRSEIIRVLHFDRLKGSLPMGVLLVVDRDRRRLGGAGWLWSSDLMAQVAAALADDRIRAEHYASVSSFEIVRDFGVDPAIRRRPVRSAAVMAITVAAGILIAWPMIRS